MVPNLRVLIFIYMVAVFSDLVSGSRSEEENQRGEILDERQILKPLMKPVLIKRDNLMQSKGYSAMNSKSNQNVKYVSIPVEEGVRPEFTRNMLYPKTRGGPVPLYQLRPLPKTYPRPTRPKVVYVVQPRMEQPHQFLNQENSLYPEGSSNYISELIPNRNSIVYKQTQVPTGYEEVVVPYSQYGGIDYSSHQDLISPYVYREPMAKENRVILYSDGPISPVRTLSELTGNELHTYPKYEYKTIIT